MNRLFTFVVASVVVAGPALAAEPLTEEKVCDYIAMRIETNHLQEEFKRNASRYDDVPRAFFQARNELLRERGWGVEEFEATQERIINAQTGMDIAADLEARADERAEERREIENNAYLSEQQKQQMIAMQEELYRAELAQVESTKADWPAVRPHRERLEHLTAWIAGNTPEPPAGCDGREVTAPSLQ